MTENYTLFAMNKPMHIQKYIARGKINDILGVNDTLATLQLKGTYCSPCNSSFNGVAEKTSVRDTYKFIYNLCQLI